MARGNPYAVTHIVGGETAKAAPLETGRRKRLGGLSKFQMKMTTLLWNEKLPLYHGQHVRGMHALGIAVDINKLPIVDANRYRGNDNK